MGCDIHMFVEYKIDDGKWTPHKGHKVTIEYEGTDDEYVEVASVDATCRNYELFAALAGVRGDGPEPKGVPDDVSDTVKAAIDQWDCDGHSHSYMSIDEFSDVLKSLNFKDTDRTDMFYDWESTDHKQRPPDYTTIVAACRKEQEEMAIDGILLDTEPSVIQHRIVFFFDN